MVTKAAIGNVVRSKFLTETAMGYARSRVLTAAARLGVADVLADGEKSVEELAITCGADAGALYRLLRTLSSFGVVAERLPGRFILAELGQPLRKDVPDSEWAAVVFWGDLIADSWAHLTECVRTGDNAGLIMQRTGVVSRWSQDPDAMSIFNAVMGTAPVEDYMPIVRAWDFARHATVADLGGGGGGLIAAVLQAFPQVRGILVDRSQAIERARSSFDKSGLGERCQLVVADLCEVVPSGADLLMLKHVLHGYTDEQAVKILANCKKALPGAGRVLLIEFVLPDIVKQVDPALETRLMSDLNMLAVTGGKERSAAEWKALLKRAGFDCLDIIPLAGELCSIIEAAAMD
jgi:hypothetical protein